MKLYKINENMCITEREESDDVQNKDKIYFTTFQSFNDECRVNPL